MVSPVFSLEPQLSKPVVIYPSLMRYHTLDRGPKYPPLLNILPFRTYSAKREDFDAIVPAQTHAFYEEIDSVDAEHASAKSPFGHWYVIHPLQAVQVKMLSTEVLGKVKVWIEEKDMYIGEHHQVEAFRDKRKETLEVVGKELWKREAAQIKDLDGTLGVVEVDEDEWAVVRPLE
jgi:hypothetical protein